MLSNDIELSVNTFYVFTDVFALIELRNRHWGYFRKKSLEIQTPVPPFQLVSFQHLPRAPILQWNCCLWSGEYL